MNSHSNGFGFLDSKLEELKQLEGAIRVANSNVIQWLSITRLLKALS
jgi:hypothetical protein